MLELKGLESIDQDLETIFHHDFLIGTTDASHHIIYHYVNEDQSGNLFVPTFGHETEPFGWNFEGCEHLIDTPEWFQSRFRIGKALWDAAVMESMNYYISQEVLSAMENEKAFPNDIDLLKKYVKNQMEMSMYYEQVRYAKEDVQKIFQQHQEEIPSFIFWEKENFFAIYSLNINEYMPVPLSESIANEIKKHVTQENRRFIIKQGQLPVEIPS